MTTTVKTPTELASHAADAVRALNHATLGTDQYGWEEPADVYTVLGALSAMAGDLPQALDQTTYHLKPCRPAGT